VWAPIGPAGRFEMATGPTNDMVAPPLFTKESIGVHLPWAAREVRSLRFLHGEDGVDVHIDAIVGDPTVAQAEDVDTWQRYL
jgi:hypothetical protein